MERRAFVAGLPAVLTAGAVAAVTTGNGPAQAAVAAGASGYANVRDFGAVGNGTTDDTAAIPSAINSFSSNGGSVFLPPGTYAVSAALQLRANVSILGAGVASKLVPRVAGMTILAFDAPSLQPVNIELAQFEINSAGIASTNGIVMRFAQFIRISQITFTGLNYSASFDRCRTVSISDSISRGSPALKAGTLRLYSSSETDYCFDVTVTNYTTFNVGNGTANGHAIIVNRGVAVLIAGFILNDGHVGGDIHGIGFYGDCQGCKVSDSIMCTGTSGVYFSRDIYTANTLSPTFCTISNVDIDQARTGGIWFNAANWITINGGNYTASGANPAGTGIRIEIGASRITLNGLTIHGFTSGHGVLAGSGVSHLTVAACQIEDCATGIGIVPGSSQYVSITGNRLIGTPTAINFGGPATNNLIRLNVGVPDQL